MPAAAVKSISIKCRILHSMSLLHHDWLESMMEQENLRDSMVGRAYQHGTATAFCCASQLYALVPGLDLQL